jgi:DNA modification methylase
MADERYNIISGDCIEGMKTLPDGCIQTVVTSPPYWGLRDYGNDGQIGLEETPDAYVNRMVEVFREIRRILRDDGTVWLNLGDSYMAAKNAVPPPQTVSGDNRGMPEFVPPNRKDQEGLKTKDLVGIPWRVAFALQKDGWWLRQDIVWDKPNPMPESVQDRCTKSHEYIFLLSKSSHYYFDNEAIKEEASGKPHSPGNKHRTQPENKGARDPALDPDRVWGADGKRNKRSVWRVTTKPFKGAHFAVYPQELIIPCVLAGTSEHGCCSKCGAPYERDRQRLNKSTYQQIKEMGHDWKAQASAAGEFPDVPVNRTTGFVGNARKPDGTACAYEVPEYKTVGWKPTCKCKGATVAPCTVFDPFTGSGTTCVVALNHGRKFIGTELNPEYIKIARDRIADEAPMSLIDMME